MRKIVDYLFTIILVIVFSFLTIRFLSYIIKFDKESVQADFSAYYTAGQSLSYGLSPYKNNFMHSPPVWDGIAKLKYSRFLYPPLVAGLFKLFNIVPYQSAKSIWSCVCIFCLIWSICLVAKIFPLKNKNSFLMVGSVILVFFPLLAHFERGQIDIFTLLLITLGSIFIVRKEESADVVGGIFFVIATLVKLHCVYLLPFIFLRKRWFVLKGYILGTLVISLLSVILLGWNRTYDYVRNQFPRIAGLINVDDSLGLAEKRRIQEITSGVGEGYVIKDGFIYKYQYFSFPTDATFVEPLSILLRGSNVPRSILSLFLFCVLLGVIWLWQVLFFRDSKDAQQEYLYWQIPIVVILLTAPLTWTMNTVWVLPFSVFFFSRYLMMNNKFKLLPLIFGFVFIAVQSKYLFLPGVFSILRNYQYVFGEIFLIIGLMIYIPTSVSPSTKKSQIVN